MALGILFVGRCDQQDVIDQVGKQLRAGITVESHCGNNHHVEAFGLVRTPI